MGALAAEPHGAEMTLTAMAEGTDLSGIMLWGFAAGSLAFIVLRIHLNEQRRTNVIRWCLLFGGMAIAYFGLHLLLGERIPPAKATIGLGFIGLPALLVGVLLLADDFLKRLKSKRQSKDSN